MKNKRPNIKCLLLPIGFLKDLTWHREEKISDYDLIPPIFNRKGLYLNQTTGFCWGEIDGLAFKVERKYFFDSKTEDILSLRLSQKEIDAINCLLKYNTCSKEVEEALRHKLQMHEWNHNLSLRKMCVDSAIRLKELRKKIRGMPVRKSHP